MKLTVTMVDGIKFTVEGGPFHIGGFHAISLDCPRVAVIEIESSDGCKRVRHLRPVEDRIEQS